MKVEKVGGRKARVTVTTGKWMLKSEPWDISWSRMKNETEVVWDGVRNYQANNYMKLMKKGDLCLFYHSVEDKKIFGIVEVTETWKPDPKDSTGRFGIVKIAKYKELKRPVTLQELKQEEKLRDLQFIRQVRLSVSICSEDEWSCILSMSRD